MENPEIKLEMVEIESLNPHPKNWKKHSRKQRHYLRNSIKEVGRIVPILINKRTMNILDGHLRYMEALEKNETEIQAIVLDIDEKHEEKALALIDTVAMKSETDEEKYKALVESINFEEDFWEKAIKQADEVVTSVTHAEYEILPEMFLETNYIFLVFNDEINFNNAKEIFGVGHKKDRYSTTKGMSLVADGDKYIEKLEVQNLRPQLQETNSNKR